MRSDVQKRTREVRSRSVRLGNIGATSNSVQDGLRLKHIECLQTAWRGVGSARFDYRRRAAVGGKYRS